MGPLYFPSVIFGVTMVSRHCASLDVSNIYSLLVSKYDGKLVDDVGNSDDDSPDDSDKDRDYVYYEESDSEIEETSEELGPVDPTQLLPPCTSAAASSTAWSHAPITSAKKRTNTSKER